MIITGVMYLVCLSSPDYSDHTRSLRLLSVAYSGAIFKDLLGEYLFIHWTKKMVKTETVSERAEESRFGGCYLPFPIAFLGIGPSRTFISCGIL